MKKIITLGFFIGVFITSFAQYRHGGNGSRHDDQYTYSSKGRFHKNDNFLSPGERDFQINRINREYQFKVSAIAQSHFMRRHQKKIAIRNAKSERNFKIQMLNKKYNSQFHNRHGRR